MKLKLALIAAAAVLSACGGGGGDTTDTPAQAAPTVAVPGDMTKYAGTWTSSCIAEGPGSARMTLVLDAGGNSASGRLYSDGYNGIGCTGPSVQVSFPFTATYLEMDGSAEKLSVSDGSETGTMLATFSGNDRIVTLNDGTETFTFTKQ
ncbi:hypothetical protein [Noviherbaspirillum sp.]|uniref:hypothetical protein n=1 Tax=Noviherbaspirillum sp. TaxID=1926288 RepID=UPI002D375480|nr:hypothetical protein [Noviherbaspirillum sp.]HZW20179.1 hypothetical protein [Noviherbaspirillum sp.]